MKVCLVGNGNSIHFLRWIEALSAYKDITLHVITFDLKYQINNVCYYFLIKKFNNKLDYIYNIILVKKLIQKIKPEILHAHYATSYGLIGSLSGYHPFIISVWGSDIYEFPNMSFIHKGLMKYIFKKGDRILSTSVAMANEIAKITPKKIEITPFGIDLDKFKPLSVDNFFKQNEIVIGTIKTLEDIYGIDYLLHAFKILKENYKNLPLKLMIVGEGSKEKHLKSLSHTLGIAEDTIFIGSIQHDKIVMYFNRIHIFACLSLQESFGVSVLEAMSCEKPCVASNIGGLKEIVEDNVTGFLVPPKNPYKAAEALEKLLLNPELRYKMGKNARKKVELFYNWDDCVKKMKIIYDDVLTNTILTCRSHN